MADLSTPMTLTPEGLAAYRAREGGKDKLTDQVIEAAERWLIAASCYSMRIGIIYWPRGARYWEPVRDMKHANAIADDAIRAATRAEKGGDAK